MKRIYFSLCILLLSGWSASAQMGHSFSVNVGGGLQNLFYNQAPEGVSPQTGYNGMFSLGYRFYFHENWGIGTDLGISFWRGKAAYEGMTSHDSYDTENSLPFEFRAYFSDWTEKQNVLTVDIPLLVSYKCPIGSDWQLLTNFGPKVHIPVSAKYTAEGTLDTRGYYPAYNAEFQSDAGHGFEKSTREFEGKTEWKAYPALYVDLGVAHTFQANLMSLSNKYDLMGSVYVGLYVDCGYMSLKGTQNVLCELQDDQTLLYHSLPEQKSLKSAIPLSCGIKVGVSIMSRKDHIRWIWR